MYIFATASAFDAQAFKTSQEVEATGGVDSYYQLQRLSAILKEHKDVQSKIVRGCLDTLVSVVETAEAFNTAAKDPAHNLIRRQSLKIWSQIENSALATFTAPPPKVSDYEPLPLDDQLAKSMTSSVSGMIMQEAQQSVSRLSKEVSECEERNLHT